MLLLERHFVRHALYSFTGRTSLYHPLAAYVYLTYRCNLSCAYCNDGAGVKYPDKAIDRELTFDEWVEVLRILRRETDVVIFTGGEPFCRPDLARILRAVRAMRFAKVVVLTNALNLHEHLDVLDSTDILMISLDTLDAARGDRVMGRKGAHARIMENIERAAALRRDKGFRLYFNTCITPDSIDDAHEVVDFALERRLGLTPLPEVRGWYPPEALVGNPRYEALVDRLVDLKCRGFDVLGSLLYVGGIKRFANYRCMPTLLVRVKPNGDLFYPCNKLNQTGGNLLALGDYGRAIHEGLRRHGPVPACDNRCHVGCYMDFSLLIQRPWWLLHEAWLKFLRKPFFSPERLPARLRRGAFAPASPAQALPETA